MQVEPTDLGLNVDSRTEADTDQIGQALAGVVEPGTVIGLVGPLGSGKTLLVRAVAEALGVAAGAIASPTFVLIHEYEGRIPVYHFDVFRLETPDEFETLGPADYWNRSGVCLVEWADRVADRLPENAWHVAIELTGATSRKFRFEFPKGSPYAARLAVRLQLDSSAARFDAPPRET